MYVVDWLSIVSDSIDILSTVVANHNISQSFADIQSLSTSSYFCIDFDSDLATDFQIPLVHSFCDSEYFVRSLCDSVCI